MTQFMKPKGQTKIREFIITYKKCYREFLILKQNDAKQQQEILWKVKVFSPIQNTQ